MVVGMLLLVTLLHGKNAAFHVEEDIVNGLENYSALHVVNVEILATSMIQMKESATGSVRIVAHSNMWITNVSAMSHFTTQDHVVRLVSDQSILVRKDKDTWGINGENENVEFVGFVELYGRYNRADNYIL